MNHAIEILKKHKLALEMNIKGIPGMVIDPVTLLNYKAQLRDVKRAITFLEVNEKGRQRRGA